GKKVAYIGPGTGLGGGFAFVDGNGRIEFKTDGHIYDVVLSDAPEFSVHYAGRRLTIPLNTRRAEDLYSGRAVGELMAAIEKAAGDPVFRRWLRPGDELGGQLLSDLYDRIMGNEETFVISAEIIDFLAQAHAQIIGKIYE